MSIVRQLVQIAVVNALRGQTGALDYVFDSKMDTLQGLLKGAVAPVLVFSIEETAESAENVTDGFLGRAGTLTGMMQSAVASGKEVTDAEGAVIMPELGETDAAFEAVLNVIDHQWRAVLHNHSNPWATVFRELVVSIGPIRTLRATDPETGTKHACRFAQFDMETLPEPLPGDPIAEAISNGLALMESDGDASYAALAQAWRGILSEGAEWQDWQKLQSALFATRGDLLAVGLGPIEGDEDSETPAMTKGVIEMDGIDPVEVTDP